ncbi:CBS domain-containing protein [Roseateles amylovorans]|uniref:CBS domain-containing protein n=1 Tax=Roseateles amylovorans TaxID=2978473 RepID=A0ABY6B364_9BURK|nr:CBS domain-containing protein [Roseateles amylovorans]UXH79276.1 CBS domain-containing protein [Roseateles amylovorans]
MFSVYGTSGKIYTGGLEQVRELAPVQAVARTRAVAPIGPQGDLTPSTVVLAGLGQGGAGAAGSGGSAGGPSAYVATEALAAYAGEPVRQVLTQVHQLMNRRLISVRSGATLRQAWRVMSRAAVGQAPVLGPMGEVRGLITRADLLRGLPDDLEDGAEVLEVARRFASPVDDAMWTPVPVALSDTPLREAAQLMLDLGLPGLPVADADGQLQGFLSRSDLLRGMTHEPPLDLWT